MYILRRNGELLKIVLNNPENHWDEAASKEYGNSMVNTTFEHDGVKYIVISSGLMRGACGYVGDIVLRCVRI